MLISSFAFCILCLTGMPYSFLDSVFQFDRNHNQALSSFITCYRVCSKNNTTGATGGTITVYPGSLVGFVLLNIYICIQCISYFALFLLVIVLSVLRFTASDYPFGIFKCFLFGWLWSFLINVIYLYTLSIGD